MKVVGGCFSGGAPLHPRIYPRILPVADIGTAPRCLHLNLCQGATRRAVDFGAVFWYRFRSSPVLTHLCLPSLYALKWPTLYDDWLALSRYA